MTKKFKTILIIVLALNIVVISITLNVITISNLIKLHSNEDFKQYYSSQYLNNNNKNIKATTEIDYKKPGLVKLNNKKLSKKLSIYYNNKRISRNKINDSLKQYDKTRIEEKKASNIKEAKKKIDKSIEDNLHLYFKVIAYDSKTNSAFVSTLTKRGYCGLAIIVVKNDTENSLKSLYNKDTKISDIKYCSAYANERIDTVSITEDNLKGIVNYNDYPLYTVELSEDNKLKVSSKYNKTVNSIKNRVTNYKTKMAQYKTMSNDDIVLDSASNVTYWKKAQIEKFIADMKNKSTTNKIKFNWIKAYSKLNTDSINKKLSSKLNKIVSDKYKK